MKLATGKPVALREGRLDKLRRDRAGSPAMRAAFPAVGQLRIKLQFQDSHPSTPAAQLHELYPPARAFFAYACPYANCDGQFDLSAAVSAAIQGELPVSAGVIECGGSRARDHSYRQACLLQLHYEISPSFVDKNASNVRAEVMKESRASRSR
jgi:hypothetical protein